MLPVATPRLVLRELTTDDAPFILELVNDPAWLRFIGDRNVHSLEDALGYIQKMREGSYTRHGFGLWAVDRRETGEVLGLCGLLRRDALAHVDVGFAFLERHRGRGYAREAAAATLDLARDRFDLRKVVAITDVDNAASQKVLEGVGFRFERKIHWGETNEDLGLYAKELGA